MTIGATLLVEMTCKCNKRLRAYNIEGLQATRAHLKQCESVKEDYSVCFWIYMLAVMEREMRAYA